MFMKYTIKNNFFSLGGSSLVYDENNEVAFKARGRVFSNIITRFHKKIIRDKNGKKLFVVRNKFWHKPFYKSAIIFEKRKKLATVSNSHLVKNGYDVVGATKPISIEGKGWNLQIKLGDEIIGRIEPPNIDSIKDVVKSVTDTYILEVFDEQDVPFLVAMMIAIDNIHDQKMK